MLVKIKLKPFLLLTQPPLQIQGSFCISKAEESAPQAQAFYQYNE
jgi:hypothetical protein